MLQIFIFKSRATDRARIIAQFWNVEVFDSFETSFLYSTRENLSIFNSNFYTITLINMFIWLSNAQVEGPPL